ncbi:MAG: hypothetical protein UY21_C0013G0003 [Microgenomates group bacterium GW2011_GWA1_48_10]|uniref:CMP/dCMP-type deaminase domain-containing protein n=1 Tax=Candidatus Gottesmanbacteria bacterium RIFCSPHIGHO2_01_FULL_47_48 TaxID=1798381 RepID=A0A1F6A4G0_9BACT|nr:MAG: hypothetical protein UY21_C0013G0003 [Microgenomates group bacterium GW2011_GWA1_48_10]OGG19595.1 MAG: hypothetical protein A2721_02890 [Candidatus Gottesmanbacteria bacterium RIFCSPHIGHO2_01_FULL_47_48]
MNLLRRESERGALLQYAPVIHAGHISLFQEVARRAPLLYFLGGEYVQEFSSGRREIRALPPEINARMVEALGVFAAVRVLENANLGEVRGKRLVVTNDTVTTGFVEKYLPGEQIEVVSAFLRWDEKSVQKPHKVRYDRKSTVLSDRQIIATANVEAEKSSDWWRQVGAVVIKEGKIILVAHNEHVPSDYSSYIDGDPRDFIKPGQLGHLSSAIHAEQLVVAEAARQGINLEGASIYMNVFPCNTCARLIIRSGMKSVYFQKGNAYLNVEEEFEAAGVEVVLVE